MGTKRLDADIRELAELMQQRRAEAAERVKRGEIPHLNFMSREAIEKKVDGNLAQVRTQIATGGPLHALADVAVYGLALLAYEEPYKEGE